MSALASTSAPLKRPFPHLAQPAPLPPPVPHRTDSLASLNAQLDAAHLVGASYPGTPSGAGTPSIVGKREQEVIVLDSEDEGEEMGRGKRRKRATLSPEEWSGLKVAEADADAAVKAQAEVGEALLSPRAARRKEKKERKKREKKERREKKDKDKGKAKAKAYEGKEENDEPGWWFTDGSEMERRRDAFLRTHASTFLALLPGEKANYISKLLASSPSSSSTPTVARPYRALEQPKSIAGGKPGIMKDYQLTGLSFLAYMAENGMNAILADEMGLGKTLQTLSLIAYLDEQHGHKGPHLLVCPLSVLGSWMSEIDRWLPGYNAVRYHGPKQERQRLKLELADKAPDLVVTTYEAYVAEAQYFKTSRRWGLVVLDEGHKIKNYQANASIQLHGIGAKMRLILTGTPLQNNLLELWSLLYFLFPKVFTEATLKPFRDSFNLSAGLYDASFLAKSQKLLEIIMLRRTKEGVKGQLSVPPREELTLYVPLSPAQVFWYTRLLSRADTMTLGEIFGSSEAFDTAAEQLAIKQLEAAEGNYKGPAAARLGRLQKEKERKGKSAVKQEEGGDVVVLDDSEDDEDATGDARVMENVKYAIESSKTGETGGNGWQKMMNLLIQLRKTCCHPYLLPNSEPEPFEIDESIVAASGKLILLDKLLKENLPKGERVLIFSGFTRMLDILEDYMTLRGFTYARLDGGTTRPRRALDIRLFQQQNSPYQVFLISTRAGGLGINLTAATTVIMYDQDWNPQTDIQAISRAHRIGQTKTVKVYRLVTEGSVEEQALTRLRKKLYLSVKIMSTMKNVTETNGDAGPANELGQTEDDAPKMTRGELAAILRGGTGALAARWETADGKSTDAFSAFRAATFDEICERGRARDGNKDTGIKLEMGEEVSAEEEARRQREEEEAEKTLLAGREAVQSRKFGGKMYTATNTDIRKEWEETIKRESSSRTVVIDGHTVLRETIGAAPWEAVKTITSDPKMAAKLASPKKGRSKNFEHEEWCGTCKDGGELFLCTGCPRVYHADACSGMSAKALASASMWYCPQHYCGGCGRTTGDAGGLLFRCQTCPSAFCEDCFSALGEEGEIEAVGDALPEFLLLGYGKRAQAYYIRCADCVSHFKENPDEYQQWRKEQDKIEKQATKEGWVW
ncbi:hypothetical protein JCM6882_002504 [Rhodosporidiobolus microsporus]